MHWLRNGVAAFRFLTILPLPGSFGSIGDDLRGALPWFPLVGLVLGGIAAAGAWFFWLILPMQVAAVALTLFLLSFSGAMHLDGLADTADGFFSARGRREMLFIMRDSRIGVMGVVALVMVLLLKAACLGSLSPQAAVRAGLLIPLAGRCALVLMVVVLPYVRPEGGLATTLYAGRSLRLVPLALAVLALAGFGFMGLRGGAAVTAAMLAVLFFSWYCRRKIGGATGDTLGASCELAETAVALSLAGQ
ncbi:MAG TPA: adenosylcobinamide-GDP ribazoletransferase [Desulfobulbaceae bacterium]|nr:adenosylcobinamide-GDP ribazoletransferase [Desulfobulbaceae bacterium]